MKSLKVLVCLSLVLCMLYSCKGSQQVVAPVTTPGGVQTNPTNPFGTLLVSECQKLAEEKPVTRAYGEGTNHRQSFAKAYAENQARAQLARAMSSLITTATQENDKMADMFSAGSVEGAGVTDENADGNGWTRTIAEGIVANAVVIKTETYMQPNRQYHVFVCLEYMGDNSGLADKIVDQVEQRIPDDERMKMEFEFNKFREEIKSKLDETNRKQAN